MFIRVRLILNWKGKEEKYCISEDNVSKYTAFKSVRKISHESLLLNLILCKI